MSAIAFPMLSFPTATNSPTPVNVERILHYGPAERYGGPNTQTWFYYGAGFNTADKVVVKYATNTARNAELALINAKIADPAD